MACACKKAREKEIERVCILSDYVNTVVQNASKGSHLRARRADFDFHFVCVCRELDNFVKNYENQTKKVLIKNQTRRLRHKK